MCDIAAPGVLDHYAAKFERVDRFSDTWYLCVLADTRRRSELWESEFRRQSQFHDTNPELSAFVSIEDKVSDVRYVRRVVVAARTDGDPGSRSEVERVEPTPQRGPDGRHRGLQFAQRIACTCAYEFWPKSQRCWEGQGQEQGQKMIVYVELGHHPRCREATTGFRCGIREDLSQNTRS